MRTATICYLAVAGLLFIIGVITGKALKKDILHGGVHLGFINSALLSIVWPITFICLLCGWAYDVIQAWKKL